MSEFKSLQKDSIADDVMDLMLNKIMDGTWAQGTKIPSENELRDQLSVSRDTVRQAIKKLSALGLLESQYERGTFVQHVDLSLYLNHMIPLVFLSEDDGTNLLEYMQVIQTASAQAAAKKATEEEIRQLEQCLAGMAQVEKDEDYYDVDTRFHITLSQISGNPLFVKSMEITSHMLTYYLTNLVRVHGRDSSIDQHRKCLDAVRGGNAEAAAMAMQEHYETIKQRLLSTIQKK